ncbi:DUF7488 domain-containing protein [Helicobacter didelphidarum]|nr:PDZ domain-containing protein [Helicobacter didelphidarum]
MQKVRYYTRYLYDEKIGFNSLLKPCKLKILWQKKDCKKNIEPEILMSDSLDCKNPIQTYSNIFIVLGFFIATKIKNYLYCSILFVGFLSIIMGNVTHANELENEFNNLNAKKIPSQIKEPEENIINSKEVQVREKDGILQSSEQEVIDLFGTDNINEKIDYSHCASYYKQASVNLGNNLYAIKLKNGAIIGYNPIRPKVKNLVKYDPFTGLFLISGNVSSKYSYEMSDIDEYALSKELASTGIKGAVAGRFQTHQQSFLQYAEFSAPTQKNGVISNICYKIYGLGVGGHGFIEKKYIDRFLTQEKPYYGDIGVRFQILDEESATFGVQFADPFFPNNPFKRGDVLISINDIAPKNWGDLEWIIANLELNSITNIKIRRGEDIKNLHVKVGRRYGGMLLTDSFLERFNIGISNDFIVERVPSQGAFSKLKKGDRILYINNVDMRQFKPSNMLEKNMLFRELFTRIQGNQVDFLEQKRAEQKIKNTKPSPKDILEQFQSKDSTQDRKNSFYRKMSENMDEFINGEMSTRGKIPTLQDNSKTNDLHAFSGDGILRDSGTQSMRTIYDMYDADTSIKSKKPKREYIKEYEELVEYGGTMNFLIDRQGFQFRIPLE